MYLCSRIQTEFDTFVIRAIFYIYKSRCLGTWQYLATLPFADITNETAWKLYYLLNTGFSEESINDTINGGNNNEKEKSE